MRIQEAMSKAVETIAATETADTAWDRMRRAHIHHLVVMEGRSIVGVVSDRDLGGAKASQSSRREKVVSDVMTASPVTVDPMTTIHRAANLLRGHTIGCLPVVDGGKLVGIVTITDLLELLGRPGEREVDVGKRWTLKNRGPRRQKTSSQ